MSGESVQWKCNTDYDCARKFKCYHAVCDKTGNYDSSLMSLMSSSPSRPSSQSFFGGRFSSSSYSTTTTTVFSPHNSQHYKNPSFVVPKQGVCECLEVSCSQLNQSIIINDCEESTTHLGWKCRHFLCMMNLSQ